MSGKQHRNRAAKVLPIALLLAAPGTVKSLQADVETLFTTPQERQIIDTNRYKTDEIVKPRVEATQTEVIATEEVREEIKISFLVSGITISGSGPHSVWINNQVYEDGDHLEDDSHIKVITGANLRVRITAPDGKRYYATSGEVVEVTYLGAVEN